MSDLTDLPFDITPEAFFLEELPEVLAEVDYPDGLGTEKMQFNIHGEDGFEVYIGFNDDDELEIEEGQASAPPIAVTTSTEHFRAIVAGDLRDRIKSEVGDVLIGPRQFKHAFLPDSVVQQVKRLNGNLQVAIEDDESGETYIVTSTIGGGAPDVENPSCKVSLDVPTLLEIAARKQNPQQLFMAGKVRIDGDMSLVLQLMGIVGAA